MRKTIFLLISFFWNSLIFTAELKVTDIQITPNLDKKSKIISYVVFKLNNVFVIEDAKIIEGKKGKFVAMPSEKEKNKFKDLCFPIKSDLRKELNEKILNEKSDTISPEDENVKITDIRIYKITKPKGKIKAFVSITLNDEFVIKEIKIIEGAKGLFVGWPSKKIEEGKFKEIIYPVKNKEDIENQIIEKYKSLK